MSREDLGRRIDNLSTKINELEESMYEAYDKRAFDNIQKQKTSLEKKLKSLLDEWHNKGYGVIG